MAESVVVLQEMPWSKIYYSPREVAFCVKRTQPRGPNTWLRHPLRYRKGGAQRMSIYALSVADAITLCGLWIAGTGTLLKSSKLYCSAGAVIAIVGFVLEH